MVADVPQYAEKESETLHFKQSIGGALQRVHRLIVASLPRVRRLPNSFSHRCLVSQAPPRSQYHP
jgi:hypothetical protein